MKFNICILLVVTVLCSCNQPRFTSNPGAPAKQSEPQPQIAEESPKADVAPSSKTLSLGSYTSPQIFAGMSKTLVDETVGSQGKEELTKQVPGTPKRIMYFYALSDGTNFHGVFQREGEYLYLKKVYPGGKWREYLDYIGSSQYEFDYTQEQFPS